MTFNSFPFNTTSFNSVSHLKKISKTTYENAKGTPSEDVARLVNENIQGLNVSDQKQRDKRLDEFIYILKRAVQTVPENESIISKIDEIKNYTTVEDLVAMLIFLIPLIPPTINQQIEQMSRQVDEIDRKTDKTHHMLSQIISNIQEKPSTKIAIAISVGTGFTFIATSLFSNNPDINYVSVIIFLVISVLTYGLLS